MEKLEEFVAPQWNACSHLLVTKQKVRELVGELFEKIDKKVGI